MMRRTMAALAVATFLLAGCGDSADEPSDEGTVSPAEAARDVAMVERMNRVEPNPILPQEFNADDMARYDLGRGCKFRIEGESAPIFVAQRERGYLKIDGELQPVSAKGGSAELPGGAHSIYIGLNSWVELVAQAGEGGDERSWPSRLVIHDSQERVAYDKSGQVTCGT
ncbi:DUF6692 family protein [Novosphingobium aquimarinum]|uniref:DUF6692 family protein n=1 Tax=Novosphingobium aquimarinum TaxID=2682494 RepID=UPI0012EB8147|nr:DUF6692 family protein [Novosphingobium aquimarinum]